MLYVNGELLDTSNRSEDYIRKDIVKDYHQVIKEQKERLGRYFVIHTRERPRRDEGGAMRFPGPRGLELRSNVRYPEPDGGSSTIELMYSDTILQKDQNQMLKRDRPNLLIKKAIHTVDIDRNPDLVYYAVRCGMVGHTPAEGKKFYIHDPKYISSEMGKQRRLEGQVLNLIYTALPEQKLKLLAKSFGVAEVEVNDIETVRSDLYDKLKASEEQRAKQPGSKARGYEAFIASSEVKDHDRVAALCSDAQSANRLVYNDVERRWELDYQDGKDNYVLKEIGGSEVGDPNSALITYLLDNPEKRNKLQGMMGRPQDRKPKERDLPPAPPVLEDGSEEVTEITVEMVMKEHKPPVLKSWLKRIDPETYEEKVTTKSSKQYLQELLATAIARQKMPV